MPLSLPPLRHLQTLATGLVWLALFVFLQGACQQNDVPSASSVAVSANSRALVGGRPDLQHPAVGALSRDRVVFCSATLIAPRVVLTAAHCIDSAFRYAAGHNHLEFRIDTPDPQGPHGYQTHHFAIDPSLLARHPQWRSDQVTLGNDVGVAVLREPVPSSLAAPLPFNTTPLRPQDWQNNEMLFLGYGLIQSVPYAISPNRKHGAQLRITEVRSDRVVIQSPGKSVCHGDSGGPALGQIGGVWHVLAVNSYALTGFAQGSRPPRTRCDGGAVSVRTDSYASFLQGWVKRFSFEQQTCQSDADCGSCGRCDTGKATCTARPQPSHARHCQPCSSDADCQGGWCAQLAEGKRCLAPCASSCCPQGAACKSVVTAQGERSVCQPFAPTCPPVSCQADSDCSAQERCTQGQCQRDVTASPRALCFPCQADAACQSSALRCESYRGQKLCLPSCNASTACPTNFRCEPGAPGRPSRCVPIDAICSIACQSASDCPNAWTCTNQRCQPQGRAQANESCERRACAADLACVDTRQGKRCLQPCHLPPGQLGGACQNERTCQSGLFCLVIRGLRRKFCAAECQANADCPHGGACASGYCVCRSDQECDGDATCFHAFGSDTGFCVARSSVRSCPSGSTCTFLLQGSYCVASQSRGEGWIGQPCSAQSPCQEGLTCVAYGQHAGVCSETCPNSVCRLGGRCVQGLCLCASSADCPTGRACDLFLDTPQRAGLCLPHPRLATPCQDDRECGAGWRCTAGQCTLPNPQEVPPTERAVEPSTELVSTEPLSDASEPAPDAPFPSSDSPPETPRESSSAPDTLPQDTAPPAGCQCQSRSPLSPWLWMWFLPLGAWFRWRRRRSAIPA